MSVLLKLIFGGMVLAFLLFTTVDRTPFSSSAFFQETSQHIDSIGATLAEELADTIKVGWSEKCLVPEVPIRLTGNRWKSFEQVYDSVYVRCFVFSNGRQKIAMLNYDLWIMHPHLASKIKKSILGMDESIDGIYLTASHTHSSIGGWASGVLGHLVVGGNESSTVNFIIEKTKEAIMEASARLSIGNIGYGEFETENLVYNRLDRENGQIDEKIRVLKLENVLNEQAIFSTFSAHAVYMDKHLNVVSSDYPGPMTRFLKGADSIKMASFAAGAVGSHSPKRSGPFDYENLVAYGENLGKIVLEGEDAIKMSASTKLRFAEFPVTLRSPHFRVSNNIRVRPWLFHLLLGESPSFISMLQVGKTIFIGLPVELSGEFYPALESHYRSLGFNLIITSFNGNYLGYVNPSKYYDTIRKSETRDMNWYGPENGEYFVSLIKVIGTSLPQ